MATANCRSCNSETQSGTRGQCSRGSRSRTGTAIGVAGRGTRQLQEAEAKVQSAVAYRNEAKLQVRQAELALERNTVRASDAGSHSKSGRISWIASPWVLRQTAGQSSSTVVEMYDPQKLQVRVDVRLEDVPMVTPGQQVNIETASSADVIHGQVLQITSSANIQKNTLEVKVELLDPPLSVSPEMLVTAAFLAPKATHRRFIERVGAHIRSRVSRAGQRFAIVFMDSR